MRSHLRISYEDNYYTLVHIHEGDYLDHTKMTAETASAVKSLVISPSVSCVDNYRHTEKIFAIASIYMCDASSHKSGSLEDIAGYFWPRRAKCGCGAILGYAWASLYFKNIQLLWKVRSYSKWQTM